MTTGRSTKRNSLATPVAALVHVFTGLGAVCAFLSVLAVFDRAWEQAFVWLAVALIVDGLDGPMARALNVGERLKRFSGERLDLIVDFLTFVFVPILALRLAGFVPGPFGLGLCAAVLLSSLFHFADLDSKSDSYHFVGFPAVWNVVVFYIFALAPGPFWVGTILIALVVLTFVPVPVVHPIRVRQWRGPTLAITAVGAVAAAAALWMGLPAHWSVQVILALVAVYYVAMSVRDMKASA